MQLTTNRSEDIEKFIAAQANAQPVRFSQAQVNKFISDLKSEVLGTGGFAVVYKGRISENMTVAIKVLNHTMMGNIDEQFMAEVDVMGKVRHNNLIKLVGYCFESDMKVLVYEFMENGSLDKILYDNKRNREWVKFYNIALETAKALAYLHEDCEETIVHRDVKPGNVLLDSRLLPKIGDFGLARLWDRNMSRVAQSGYKGTHGFAAPEVSLGWGDLTDKCDVYSFGMMLFEILSRKQCVGVQRWTGGAEWFPGRVWDMYESKQLDLLIKECGIEKHDTDKAKTLAVVALWCCQFESGDRPPMSYVLLMLKMVIPLGSPPKPFPHYDSSRSGSSSGASNSSKSSSSFNQSSHEKGWSPEKNASIQEEGKPQSGAPPFSNPATKSDSMIRVPEGSSPERNASMQEEGVKAPNSNPATESELMLARFRQLYPPNGEEYVVVYTSSMAGLGDIEHYKAVVSMLEDHKIKFAVHDVSKSMTILQEDSILLPVLFVKGRSIDYHDLKELRAQGKLGILFDEIAKLQKQAEESQLLLGKSSTKCFPGDEDTVVVYTTSEGGNFNLCERLFLELEHFKIKFGVQDVSEAPASMNELGTILGKTIWDENLPLVLVKERWIHL